MGNVFRFIVLIAPVFAIVFYYVITQQSRHEMAIQKDESRFEQIWNEFQRDFVTDKKAKVDYQQRADRAAAMAEELEKREEEQARKAEQFEREFEQALKDKDAK